MQSLSRISKIALLGVAAALSACQEAGEFTSVNPSENSRGSDPEGGRLLLSDTFSDDGALQVVTDQSGQIHYMVQARMGSKAEQLMQRGARKPTFADIYRTLHEGTREVPDIVRKVSAQLEAQKLLAQPEPESPAAEVLPKAGQSAEGESDPFWHTYCTDIYEGATHYAKKFCEWKLSTNTLRNGYFLKSDGQLIDRTYGWNNTGWTATMSHSVSTWKPTIDAYSVSWIQWGGIYQNAQAKITLPSGKMGELGITAHRALRRRFVDLGASP